MFQLHTSGCFKAYDLSFMSHCFLCLEFKSLVRLRYDFILNSVLVVLYSPKVVFRLSSGSWDVLGELMKFTRALVYVPVPFILLTWLGIWS